MSVVFASTLASLKLFTRDMQTDNQPQVIYLKHKTIEVMHFNQKTGAS